MAQVVEKFILCDDIRSENTGKIMIIGMYPNDRMIILKNFPYTHRTIAFFLSVKGDLPKGEIEYEIIGPENDIIFKAPSTAPLRSDNDQTYEGINVIIQLGNLTFQKPGEHKLLITFPNNEQIVASFFLLEGEKNGKTVRIK